MDATSSTERLHLGLWKLRRKVAEAFGFTATPAEWKGLPVKPNGTVITGQLTGTQLEQLALETPVDLVETSVAPHIPPEVISQIIMHATDSYPAPLSSHRLAAADESTLPSTFSQHKDKTFESFLHSKSMTLKLTMSSVCWQWREIAKEFLFNSIHLSSSQQLRLLWHALEGDKERSGGVEGPRSAAWSVREVIIADVPSFPWYITPEDGLPPFNVTHLVKRCPNIVSYQGFGTFAKSQSPGAASMRAVFQGIMHPDDGSIVRTKEIEASLRAVDNSWLAWEFEIFRTAASSPLRIVKLHFQVLEGYQSWDSPIVEGIHFPFLVNLRVDGCLALRIADAFILPALRRFTFRPPLRPDSESSRLAGFLDRHGANLEELSVLGLHFNHSSFERSCAQLLTLNIPLTVDEAAIHFHPTVTKVGILGLHDMAHQTDQESIVAVFNGYLKKFPALRVIQDLSWRSQVKRERALYFWDSEDSIQCRAIWSAAAQVLEDAGIALIDWKGRRVAMDRRRELREHGDLVLDTLNAIL